ncbi:uncharacterized protein EKO05_0005109 [Ascochyta rabiei]|nr:uncharacterized protein EKO05_0005109 [Ascochyta rabiei]UPX14632.1 hypothetical protein EKO05_0005109 [Ascochyta rabiei]
MHQTGGQPFQHQHSYLIHCDTLILRVYVTAQRPLSL